MHPEQLQVRASVGELGAVQSGQAEAVFAAAFENRGAEEEALPVPFVLVDFEIPVAGLSASAVEYYLAQILSEAVLVVAVQEFGLGE